MDQAEMEQMTVQDIVDKLDIQETIDQVGLQEMVEQMGIVDKILDDLGEEEMDDVDQPINIVKVPKPNMSVAFTDQILAYLQAQENISEPEAEYMEPYYLPTESAASIESLAVRILEELLMDVKYITSFREVYAEKKKEHNQYQLFDLVDHIPKFFINQKLMAKMCFRETLLISKVSEDNTAQPCGGLCLDVQSAAGIKWDKHTKFPDFTEILLEACGDVKKKYDGIPEESIRKDLEEYEAFLTNEMKREYNKFLVHVSSQFNVNEMNGGSRITSWVDKDLHTLEEGRREYISKEDDKVDEKQLYIGMGKLHYDLRTDDSTKGACSKKCFSFERARNFVGEAANFLLMRYLAITRYMGSFELAAIYIEGDLCRNIYDCMGPMGGFINNERMDLCKIYRLIVEKCGIIHKCCTILSLDGYIMKQDWESCDYVLQINPLISPKKPKASLVIHPEKAWEYDLQLLSKYLDHKTKATMKMQSYLKDHKEVVGMISDYVQNILQIKPENILNFTIEYFMNFAPYLIPRMEYFEDNSSQNQRGPCT